jgi:hypothetical protein
MISKSPRYANVITFGLPLFLVFLGLLLWVLPQSAPRDSALAILLGTWFVFWFVIVGLVANAILSQLAGVIATSKGRRFAPFYFIGLLVSFVVPLIVAAASKPKV